MKDDFSFDTVYNGEYYFKVTGKTQEHLNDRFNDIGFNKVSAVIYVPVYDSLKVECMYIFNVMYYELNDDEIKNVLKEKYKELIDETRN